MTAMPNTSIASDTESYSSQIRIILPTLPSYDPLGSPRMTTHLLEETRWFIKVTDSLTGAAAGLDTTEPAEVSINARPRRSPAASHSAFCTTY